MLNNYNPSKINNETIPENRLDQQQQQRRTCFDVSTQFEEIDLENVDIDDKVINDNFEEIETVLHRIVKQLVINKPEDPIQVRKRFYFIFFFNISIPFFFSANSSSQ